jgi:hypothetical protein
VGPASDKTGGKVLQLGQLDLQFAFMAFGTEGKDVEDQCRSIDNPAVELAFKIALLGSGDVVIEDDEIRLVHLGDLADLLSLAFAHVERRIRRLPTTLDNTHHTGSRT